MEIPLQFHHDDIETNRAAKFKLLEHDILAAKKGNWEAKNNLVRVFTPLISSLAQKRSSHTSEINKYIEAGKNGLFTAVRKYKQNVGPDKFQIFALNFIEASMDGMHKEEGFFSRLFRK